MKKEVQREVKKGVKDEITGVPKAQIMKMMPKATNPDAKVKPVHYWGGVIYTAVKMKKFRALKGQRRQLFRVFEAMGGEPHSARSLERFCTSN